MLYLFQYNHNMLEVPTPISEAPLLRKVGFIISAPMTPEALKEGSMAFDILKTSQNIILTKETSQYHPLPQLINSLVLLESSWAEWVPSRICSMSLN